MIDRESHPKAWALMLYEIDEVREHLEDLVKEMAADGRIDEEDFRVQIGHAYAHLNRTWNRRDTPDELTDENWERFTKFPTDIEPIA